MTSEQIFLSNITKLMDTVYSKPGYRVSIDHKVDISQGPVDSIAKLRQAKLALNLNLFKDGIYLTQTSDYAELGSIWTSLDPHNIWGGELGFGCIFVMLPTTEEAKSL